MNRHRLLFVDDEKKILTSLKRNLLDSPYDCDYFSDPKQALLSISENRYAVIVSDIKMPELGGVEFLEKAGEIDPLPTRIILTGNAELSDTIDSINNAKVQFYLQKPWRKEALLKTITEAVALFDEASDKIKTISILEKKVNSYGAKVDKLEGLAYIDPLTGLKNRRGFDETFTERWLSAIRHKRSLSLIVVDIDRFKLINDTIGHSEGDAVLKKIAGAIRSSLLRPDDFAARYGGEEFAIILADSDKSEEVAQRIQQSVCDLKIQHPAFEAGFNVSVSMGISSTRPHEGKYQKPEEFFHVADMALYQAKNEGRGRYIISMDS